MKSIFILLFVSMMLFSCSCSKKQTQTALNTQTIETVIDTDTTIVKKEKKQYTCGAKTLKGKPCKRRVSKLGEKCYQHKSVQRNKLFP